MKTWNKNVRVQRGAPYLLMASMVTVVVVLAVAPVQEALGLLAMVLGASLFSYVAVRRPSIGLILLAAFALRALLALLGYYAFELPEGTGDAQSFDEFAHQLAEGSWAGLVGGFTAGSYFFAWLTGALYWGLGYSPLLGVFLNVFFGTGVVFNGYLLAREFRGERFATITALVLAVFPILILYSAVFLREAGWVYFFTLALFLFTRWYDRPTKTLYLVAALAAAVVTGMFHSYGVVVLAVFCLFALVRLARVGMDHPDQRGVSLVSFGLLAGVILAVLGTGIGLGKVGPANLNFDWLIALQDVATRGRAAYPEFLVISSWPEVIWKLPARIAYLLFTPFPWMIEAPLDVIGAVDAILYLMIAVLLAVHAKAILRDPRLIPLAAVLVLLIVVVSLTVGNYGTGVRHRAKLVALMIVLLPVERFTTPAVDWVTDTWTTIQEGSWFRRLVPAGLRDAQEESTQVDSRD